MQIYLYPGFSLSKLSTLCRFLKLKIELPYDPASPLLGYTHKKKNIIRKDTGTPMFIPALFTTAKTLKQLKCPSTE